MHCDGTVLGKWLKRTAEHVLKQAANAIAYATLVRICTILSALYCSVGKLYSYAWINSSTGVLSGVSLALYYSVPRRKWRDGRIELSCAKLLSSLNLRRPFLRDVSIKLESAIFNHSTGAMLTFYHFMSLSAINSAVINSLSHSALAQYGVQQ